MDDAPVNYAGVEASQAPTRAGRVAGSDLRVVDRVLDAEAVDAERAAGRARFCELDRDFAYAIALAQAHLAPVQTEGGEIFAQRAGIEREALSHQLLDSFGGDDEQRLVGAAVDFRMRPGVAADALGRDRGFGDRPLRDSAG